MSSEQKPDEEPQKAGCLTVLAVGTAAVILTFALFCFIGWAVLHWMIFF
jgi:hypothetical protein